MFFITVPIHVHPTFVLHPSHTLATWQLSESANKKWRVSNNCQLIYPRKQKENEKLQSKTKAGEHKTLSFTTPVLGSSFGGARAIEALPCWWIASSPSTAIERAGDGEESDDFIACKVLVATVSAIVLSAFHCHGYCLLHGGEDHCCFLSPFHSSIHAFLCLCALSLGISSMDPTLKFCTLLILDLFHWTFKSVPKGYC